ncbi:High-affinity branched-chain amino acid transport system permease protein LivH [compost metagenome]
MFLTYIFLIAYSIALLALISLGLAVIFGMMKVINLAHGEFMMLGAYAAVLSSSAGIPYILSVLFATMMVGVFGVIVERLIVRRLYGRIIDTLLATWGLSLLLVGVATASCGPQALSIQAVSGSVSIAGTNFSLYSLFVIGVAAAMLVGTWMLAVFTNIGLIVRGTIQRSDIADALGVNTDFVYMGTFAYGSAMAGLAGAVLAPLTGASPMMGTVFVSKAFINVIVGGGLPLIGTAIASTLFGTIDGLVSYIRTSIAGEVAVLICAVLLLRILPQGITGRFKRGI